MGCILYRVRSKSLTSTRVYVRLSVIVTEHPAEGAIYEES